MTTIETYLPLFTGFYNTLFEPSEEYEIDCINQERRSNGLEDVDFDDVDFDYETYKNEVANQCVDYVERELKDLFPSISVEFQKVVSPNFYNFSNDSINVKIQLDTKKILNYLDNVVDDFETYLQSNYKGYDGFIPSHSTNVNEWIESIKNENNKVEHKLGSILEFILTNEEYTSYDLLDQVSTCITSNNYNELTEV